jgi:hypothetical protein
VAIDNQSFRSMDFSFVTVVNNLELTMFYGTTRHCVPSSKIAHMQTKVAPASSRHRVRLGRIAYGIRELAEAIGVSPEFIRLEIERGKLETFYAGRRLLITAKSFEDYVKIVKVSKADRTCE